MRRQPLSHCGQLLSPARAVDDHRADPTSPAAPLKSPAQVSDFGKVLVPASSARLNCRHEPLSRMLRMLSWLVKDSCGERYQYSEQPMARIDCLLLIDM